MRESAFRCHSVVAAVRPPRFFLLASPLLMVGAVWAQAPTLAFEVASVRAAEFPNPGRGGGPQQFRAGMQLDAGRLDWGFASLADMIQYAFRVNNYQVSGPDWIRSSRWNVVARLPEGASKDNVPEMMQALLAERFHLKVHHEKRNQPVYALEVARGGAHIESVAPSSDDPAAASSDAVGPGFFPGPFGRGPGAPPPDSAPGRVGGPGPGVVTTTGANGSTARISQGNNCSLRLELPRLTMQDLAVTLTPFLDKPVIDATELKGSFKATLDLPMEVMFTMMQNMMRTNGMPAPGAGGPGRGPSDGGGPGGRGGPPGCDPGDLVGDGSADTSRAAIFKAVQKLGLKLEARKSPFDTVIIDRIEKTPSDN